MTELLSVDDMAKKLKTAREIDILMTIGLCNKELIERKLSSRLSK